MKWQIVILSVVIFVFMSFSAVWANDGYVEESDSQISASNMASIAPLMKSSGSKSSSSSSSKKIKVKGGDDDDEGDATGTDDSSGGFPWWLIIVIGVVILALIAVAVWYLFLR